METIVLKLYVTGQTSKIEKTIANLREICDKEFEGHFEMSIINILEEPERAISDNIWATPTLVRANPRPDRRVIGDLSSGYEILKQLDLQSQGNDIH